MRISCITLCVSVFLSLGMGNCDQRPGAYSSDAVNQNHLQIRSFVFSGSKAAWFVRRSSGDLWHTSDGGENWSKVSGAVVGGRFHSVSFINDQSGWAVGEQGRIWHTSDGGRKWLEIAKLETPVGEDWRFITTPQMQFVDELNGWIIETFSVWRTEDAGHTWQRVFSTLDWRVKGQPVRGHFLDSRRARISGTNGEIYSTDDGGKSWRIQTLLENGDCEDINFVDERFGWLSCYAASEDRAKLFRTQDGGRTWQAQEVAGDVRLITSIHFLNQDEGWAVGRIKQTRDAGPSVSSGTFLHTADGGKSWQPSDVVRTEPFFEQVYFVNEQYGWLSAQDSVYRTNDGGKSWQLSLTGSGAKSKSD